MKEFRKNHLRLVVDNGRDLQKQEENIEDLSFNELITLAFSRPPGAVPEKLMSILQPYLHAGRLEITPAEVPPERLQRLREKYPDLTSEESVALCSARPFDSYPSFEDEIAREQSLVKQKVHEELQARLNDLKQRNPDIDVTLPLEWQSEEHRQLIVDSYPHYFNGGAFMYWEDMDALIEIDPNQSSNDE